IHEDSEERAHKEFGAFCFPIGVPDDVRVTVRPVGGVQDFEAMFHEGAQALHFANTRSPRFEFQHLGDNTGSEAVAITFADLFAEPEYIEHYQHLVRDYNFSNSPHQAPLMSGSEKREL